MAGALFGPDPDDVAARPVRFLPGLHSGGPCPRHGSAAPSYLRGGIFPQPGALGENHRPGSALIEGPSFRGPSPDPGGRLLTVDPQPEPRGRSHARGPKHLRRFMPAFGHRLRPARRLLPAGLQHPARRAPFLSLPDRFPLYFLHAPGLFPALGHPVPRHPHDGPHLRRVSDLGRPHGRQPTRRHSRRAVLLPERGPGLPVSGGHERRNFGRL